MRATLTNHRYLPFRGGSELYVQKFAEWLAGCGWEARIVTTNAFDLEYFWDRRRRSTCAPPTEVVNGIEVERLSVGHPPGSSFLFQASRRGMGEASRILERPQPFRCVSSLLPNIEGLAMELQRGPQPDLIVGTNLSLEALALNGIDVARAFDVPFILLPFAHIGRHDDERAQRYVSMPHQRELVQKADLVIALTEIEARFLESLGADSHRVVVAGAGVGIDAGEPLSRPKRANERDLLFTILSIGAMARDKGTFDLVEASRLLHRQGLEHQLVLVGPELSAFTEWFRESGASECEWIKLKGIVSEDEKFSLLDTADVFVLPSRTESFGIVYLEAWARGLPVIGADVGAVPEVISNNEDGLLVPFGNPDAIASAILAIAEDPGLAGSLATRGLEKVRRKYTWDHVFGRIETSMSKVLGIEVR